MVLKRMARLSRPVCELLDALKATLATIFCFWRRHSEWYKAKQKRVKEHEEACRRMTNEVDLLNVLTLLRQSRFLGQTRLKDYQRQLIPNFRKYSVKMGDGQLADDGPFYECQELESLA